MKRLANKMVALTFVGLIVAFFTFISIPISFKLWHLNGLILPLCGIFVLFYIAISIELMRRKCQIKSYYDLSMLLVDKEPNQKTSLIKGQNFRTIGLLYGMISAMIAFIVLFLSFCLFH